MNFKLSQGFAPTMAHTNNHKDNASNCVGRGCHNYFQKSNNLLLAKFKFLSHQFNLVSCKIQNVQFIHFQNIKKNRHYCYEGHLLPSPYYKCTSRVKNLSQNKCKSRYETTQLQLSLSIFSFFAMITSLQGIYEISN